MLETKRAAIIAAFLIACGVSHAAPIELVDDRGATVRLPQPARRIVSLAPHVTETLFAAGAGPFLVGAVAYSDYPEAAKRLPRVGDTRALDVERILSLEPDLLVVWLHGSSQRQLDLLRTLGIPMYYDEPRQLDDVARSIERFGRLAGTEPIAHAAAAAFRARLSALRTRYEARPPVSVFYQVWSRPLLTINRQHLISDVITLCGGRNLFAELPMLVPDITIEAVIERDPEVIATADMGRVKASFSPWTEWKDMTAVKRGNLVGIAGDHISRHTPRILDGAERLCEALERARARRSDDPSAAGPPQGGRALMGLPQLQQIIAGWAQRQAKR
jgi:iron complex transport system substrate-binding protein